MLDKIDRQILNCLQDNARMKFSDMAKKIGKPVSTVFERVKRLENDGVIKSYVAILDPEKIDKGFTAFLLGQAKLGENIDLDEVGRRLAKIPNVKEVHFITGEWDYLIKMSVKDQKEYYKVIKEIAKALIARGSGMIVPKSFKQEVTFEL